MIDVIKLVIVFVGIVIALRKNLFVGYTLFLAGLLIAVIFNMSLDKILLTYRDVIVSPRFLGLLGIIILITFLGKISKEIGSLDRLVSASQKLKGGPRTAAMAIPVLVGMMPMPGGALLSAPLIGKVLPTDKYPAEFASAVNYWSRHVIEFFWPIYPGVILAAGMTSLPIKTLMLMNFPMTIMMVLIGYIFLIRKIHNPINGNGQLFGPILEILGGVWPIVLAITIYAIIPVSLLISVTFSTILLLVIKRPSYSTIKSVSRESFSPRFFMLVFGIISFQQMLEVTDAVSSINLLSTELGFPSALIIILVAFSSGLLTGMLVALIGLSFSILSGYLYQPDIDLGNIFLAFLAGYVGMIFSPTHFCLILTNEFFKSSLTKVYQKFAFPLIILFLFGLFLYFIGYPWNTLS
jgi:integral membrane protein (TIGR00529 family)